MIGRPRVALIMKGERTTEEAIVLKKILGFKTFPYFRKKMAPCPLNVIRLLGQQRIESLPYTEALYLNKNS